MLTHDGQRDSGLTMDLTDQARAMRDAAIGRYLSMAWHGLRALATRLFHPAPAQQPRLR